MAGLTPSIAQQDEVLLAINSGSSSLKIGFFRDSGADEQLLLYCEATDIGRASALLRIADGTGQVLVEHTQTIASQPEALSILMDLARSAGAPLPAGIGHRIVHGGPNLVGHQRITGQLVSTLRGAIHFAPLHIPASVELIREAQRLFPETTAFACFDTAFHRSLPESARRLPLPSEYDAAGIYRYGFHGLSYEAITHRLGKTIPDRTIAAHLGNGSSLCALQKGRSIHTTMSFTPTGGIPMGTRSGDLDPAVLLFLLRNHRLNTEELEAVLNHRSGLSALSEGESDVRELIKREAEGDPHAQLALAAFVNAIRMAIGSYAALLGGLDLLVFTGGIGEHSGELRGRICRGMSLLGISGGDDCKRVTVLPAEEERQIARICRSLL